LGRQIALTHHEKWDGTGYPSGTEGDKIPIEGRITAIADVFDALTTRRPYKEAIDVNTALGMIEDGGGTQFDPDLVNAFFDVKEEILDVRQTYWEQKPSILFQLSEGDGACGAK
jgi:putative two-component system response regulator